MQVPFREEDFGGVGVNDRDGVALDIHTKTKTRRETIVRHRFSVAFYFLLRDPMPNGCMQCNFLNPNHYNVVILKIR